MRWKESGERKLWSQRCVESSSTCNKVKQEELNGYRGAAVKTSQMPHFLGSRGWEELSLCWEFPLPEGHSFYRCCPPQCLEWFRKKLLLQRKRERKRIWVCPDKKVIKRWWSALWLTICWILMTGTWWFFGSHTVCLHYCYSFACVIYSSRLWEHKLGSESEQAGECSFFTLLNASYSTKSVVPSAPLMLLSRCCEHNRQIHL